VVRAPEKFGNHFASASKHFLYRKGCLILSLFEQKWLEESLEMFYLLSLTHTTYTSLDGKNPVLWVVDGKGVTDFPEDGNVDDPRDHGQGSQPVWRDFAYCRQHKINLKKGGTKLIFFVDSNGFKYQKQTYMYRGSNGFGQAKFPDGGSVLGLSQFLQVPQLPPKILLISKVVKIDPKIIIASLITF